MVQLDDFEDFTDEEKYLFKIGIRNKIGQKRYSWQVLNE